MTNASNSKVKPLSGRAQGTQGNRLNSGSSFRRG
jgi:hypothetical protein